MLSVTFFFGTKGARDVTSDFSISDCIVLSLLLSLQSGSECLRFFIFDNVGGDNVDDASMYSVSSRIIFFSSLALWLLLLDKAAVVGVNSCTSLANPKSSGKNEHNVCR